MIALGLLLLACGAPEPDEAPPPPPVPASAPAAEATPPSAFRGVRVLHHRQGRGRTPEHVSATWVDDGLQVMLTGLQAPCEATPAFSMVMAADTLRLVEQTTAAPEAETPCQAPHTLMLQIDGLSARDLTVEVVRGDGEAFASTAVKATDH